MDLLDREKYFKKRDMHMCDRFKGAYKKALFTDIQSSQVGRGDFKVNGVLKYDLSAVSALKPLFVQYWAASPPDYLTSFSGSGLPFANEDIAFEGTPSKGVAPVVNGTYSFYVNYPNAYYTNLGTKYVPPSVHLQVVDDQNNILTPVHTVKLGEGIPFRTESATEKRDWNSGPSFYQNPAPIRSQWEILVDSGYPTQNNEPENFWGGRRPQ